MATPEGLQVTPLQATFLVSGALKKLTVAESSEAGKQFYRALSRRYRAANESERHRIVQELAARAEIAHTLGDEQLKQRYYNGFRLAALVEDTQSRQTHRREEITSTPRLADRLHERLAQLREDLLHSIKEVETGEDEFALSRVIELHSISRTYGLREVKGEPGRLHRVLSTAEISISPEERARAVETVQEQAASLVSALKETFPKELPSVEYEEIEPMPLSELPGFKLVGGGTEVNVYLHEPTMMVYKVRHSHWSSVPHRAGPSHQELALTAHRKIESAYGAHNAEALAHMNALQLPTYFFTVPTAGEEVPVMVQPYLDPHTYGSYDPSEEERTRLRELGFDDAHSGNMAMHLDTHRVMLFDCVYAD
jgi:hypothetical protein